MAPDTSALPLHLIVTSGNVSAKDAHGLMVQPLFNAGLFQESITHWEMVSDKTSASEDVHQFVSLRLQRIALMPLVFDSEHAIISARGVFEASVRDTFSQALAQKLDLAASSLPAATLPLCYHWGNDLALIRLVSRTFAALSDLEQALAPPFGLLSPEPLQARATVEGSRLQLPEVRVTVVSAHLRWHSVCRALCPTIEELASLDGVRVAVAFAPSSRIDDTARRVATSSSEVVYLSPDLSEARAQLHATRPHVLMFTDVGMNSWTTSMAHTRLAPVQLALWGHHGSSGLPSIDFYVVADTFERARAHAKHSEQLLRLQTGLGVFLREEDFKPKAEESEERRDRISRFDLGVVENATLYLCAQSLPKFHPRFDYAMERILDGDPAGVIVIPVDRQGQSGWLSTLKRRLLRTLGLAKRCRVVFCDLLSERSMFDLLEMADVSIDTFPVGGGITSLESLGNGVPTVTCGACQSVIRTTSAALSSMGISNLTAGNPGEFATLAIRTANDAHFNSEMRRLLAQRSQLIFGRRDTIQEWERLLWRLARMVTAAHANGIGNYYPRER